MSPKIPSKHPNQRGPAQKSAPARTRDQKNKRAYQGKDEISLPSLDPRRKQPVVLDPGLESVATKADGRSEQQQTVLQYLKGLIKS
jgi:hypothetical protein